MDEECMVCHEPTGKAGRGEDSLYTPNGIGPFCEQCWDDAWPVMVPEAPDPALLALARLGALVVRDYFRVEGFIRVRGHLLDSDAAYTGVTVKGDYYPTLAPGIAEAIGALLAPDAGEVQP